MFQRRALAQLRLLLSEFPAVAILGPRQVGKTTLAWMLADALGGNATYLDLEDPADAVRLSDAAAWFDAHRDALVVLDEVQRAPALFAELRGVIDRRRRSGRRNGQFVLLGSATGALLQQSAESLAGRVAYIELPPLSALEVPDAQALWLRGGFPDAYAAVSDASSLRWRQQFVATYLERDIPQLGPRIPAATLRRLWTMLAHDQGGILNAARLASALSLSGQTVGRYLDLLADLMLVRRLPPWARNAGKRLVRAPKVYVRDSGVVHALLGLASLDDLLSHPVAGASWEGHVVDNLIAAAPPSTPAWYYCTAAGAEIDLVLEPARGERWAIEVKRSTTPAVSRGFHTGADDIGATERFVVHAGSDAFPLPGGIQAVPLRGLQQRLEEAG